MRIREVTPKDWDKSPLNPAQGKYAEVKEMVITKPFDSYTQIDFETNKEKTLVLISINIFAKKNDITLKFRHPSKTSVIIWKMPV